MVLARVVDLPIVTPHHGWRRQSAPHTLSASAADAGVDSVQDEVA